MVEIALELATSGDMEEAGLSLAVSRVWLGLELAFSRLPATGVKFEVVVVTVDELN